MKQRIKLAQALVHDPDLLFLDEPTNGMDPKGRDEMLELIRDLAHNKGVNLILSSHLLPDVEYTCDRVVVMDKGRIAAQGPIAELKGPRGQRLRAAREGRYRSARERVCRAAGMDCHATDEDVMRVFVPEGLTARAVFEVAARERHPAAAPAPERARRSKTCSREPSEKSSACRFTIRATAASAARGTRAATRGWSLRRTAMRNDAAQPQVHGPAAARLGAVSGASRPGLRLDQFPAGRVSGAHGQDVPRVPGAAEPVRVLRHRLRRRRADRQRSARERAADLPVEAAHACSSTSPARPRRSSPSCSS